MYIKTKKTKKTNNLQTRQKKVKYSGGKLRKSKSVKYKK